MTRDDFMAIFYGTFRDNAMAFLKAQPPVRMTKGNIKGGYLQSTALEYDINKGFGLSWETDYIAYTVERWISPRWKGRENPNEQWIRKRGIAPLLNLFTAQYGGKWYER